MEKEKKIKTGQIHHFHNYGSSETYFERSNYVLTNYAQVRILDMIENMKVSQSTCCNSNQVARLQSPPLSPNFTRLTSQ